MPSSKEKLWRRFSHQILKNSFFRLASTPAGGAFLITRSPPEQLAGIPAYAFAVMAARRLDAVLPEITRFTLKSSRKLDGLLLMRAVRDGLRATLQPGSAAISTG